MNLFSKHIPFDQLVSIAERHYVKETGENIRGHLEKCSQCAGTLLRLESSLELMRSDDAKDAPRDVLLRAIGIFASPVQKDNLARRIIAALNFDSFTIAPAFGTRSGSSESRQLIYGAGDNDIDLHLSTKDDYWTIAGQVLGQSCTDGTVHLDAEGFTLSADLNEACEFNLSNVPAGDYRLLIQFSDVEVEIPRIELHK